MRAGKMGSFLSWAVSTRILRGPLGQSTASRSEETTAEIIQTGAVNQDKDAGGSKLAVASEETRGTNTSGC